jgi:hypothetical protein
MGARRRQATAAHISEARVPQRAGDVIAPGDFSVSGGRGDMAPIGLRAHAPDLARSADRRCQRGRRDGGGRRGARKGDRRGDGRLLDGREACVQTTSSSSVPARPLPPGREITCSLGATGCHDLIHGGGAAAAAATSAGLPRALRRCVPGRRRWACPGTQQTLPAFCAAISAARAAPPAPHLCWSLDELLPVEWRAAAAAAAARAARLANAFAMLLSRSEISFVTRCKMLGTPARLNVVQFFRIFRQFLSSGMLPPENLDTLAAQ